MYYSKYKWHDYLQPREFYVIGLQPIWVFTEIIYVYI